jgi:hypothetical protein
MRLSYSILWFDDTEEFFDILDIDGLKSEILSWGFLPEIKLVKTPEEFWSYKPFEKIDLIVVDRNLEEYGEGQNFIADLRDHSIYTEVIFYTAGNASDLWDAIREKQLEGVFVSNRSVILSKIYKVGHQAIRKVLDLENMRGIVMAELGELDHLLDDILRAGMPSLPAEKQSSIYKKFQKQISDQNKRAETRLASFIENPQVDEMINLSDSYKRWLNFQRLSDSHEKLKTLNSVGDFTVEILKPRNFLAHSKPEINKDGAYVFQYQGEEYIFDDNVSSDLRKTILRYKQAFSSIISLLGQ